MRSLRLASAAALILAVSLGAGCGNPAPAENTPAVQAPPSTTPPAASSTAPNATSSAVLPPIDATWKTYTNAALKFSFQYPVHGPYAPSFVVQFLAPTNPVITSGCYEDSSVKGEGAPAQTVTLNGITFCHTVFTDRATMHGQEHDYWATQKNNTIILVSFTSQVYLADTSVISGCEPGGRLLGTPTCQPYDLDFYQRLLAQIMGTFTFTP